VKRNSAEKHRLRRPKKTPHITKHTDPECLRRPYTFQQYLTSYTIYYIILIIYYSII